MNFGERPTKHQDLGRNLAIGVCVATAGLWALLAGGWTWDSLQEYLMGERSAPIASPSATVVAKVFLHPTPTPAKPKATVKPTVAPKPAPSLVPVAKGLHLGTPKFQPKRLLLPVTGSLKPVPLMLRTQADGRSYVDIPDATPATAEPHGFHSPDGEFMDGVLAKGPHGGSRVTFRLMPGAVARAFVSSAGVMIAVVTLPQH